MKIVVISPHPDDETLGAGGFLLRHKALGNHIYWINVTDAEAASGYSESFLMRRKEQIRQINEFYGFKEFYNLKFRPSNLENEDKGKIIDSISACIKKIEPDCVLLPNPYDAHSDHRITFEAGMTCTKIFRYPSIKTVMTMEILSETDFSNYGKSFEPNLFVDISEYLEGKMKAMRIYDTELDEHPFPRSLEAIKALAVIRGQMAGCKYAEAFRIIKRIEQ